MSGYRTVTCACGAVQAVLPAHVTFTRFRCWACLKDDTPPNGPTLTLIHGGKSA